MATPIHSHADSSDAVYGPPVPQLIQIRDLVYQVAGIFHPDNRMSFLEERCARRMQATRVNSLREYYECLTTKPTQDAEMANLLNDITVGETCFFRNQPQLDALRNIVLPGIVETRAKAAVSHLRIWSAGCSTGEEPYTLSILLFEETAKTLAGWTFEILATDLNHAAIAHAQQGSYGEESTRNLTPYLIDKYFEPCGGELQIKPEIKCKVSFAHANLLDETAMALNTGFDIILCCNVLMYFEAAARQRLVRQFYNSLLPHGYFLLGHAESIFGVNERFRLVHMPSTTAYVRSERKAG